MKSPSWAEVVWKRGIPCKPSRRTAVWCFAQMIGDIRMNIEKERAKNCIFISFLRTRNKGKSGSSVIDGKFARLSCHAEPTLPSDMTVCKYWKRQYCWLQPLLCNSQGRWRRLAAGSTGTTSSCTSGSSSNCSCSCTVVVQQLQQ